MIFADVKLPDEIGVALETGKLVIFAGAGVSAPPPSKLPLFNELACPKFETAYHVGLAKRSVQQTKRQF